MARPRQNPQPTRKNLFAAASEEDREINLYLGKKVLFFNTDLDSLLHPSLSMGLPMQGAKKADSGPKGAQMQQTDLPADYNIFPEGAI